MSWNVYAAQVGKMRNA